jgi:hypothetical protein
LRRPAGDLGIDRIAMVDDRGHQLAGQLGGLGVTLGLGEMALQDRLGGSLTEVGFEDRGER